MKYKDKRDGEPFGKRRINYPHFFKIYFPFSTDRTSETIYSTCIAGGNYLFYVSASEIEAVWERPCLEEKEVIKLRLCRVPRPPMKRTLRG